MSEFKVYMYQGKGRMVEIIPKNDTDIESTATEEPSCNPHPDAPHGFNRNGSHNAGRYVCDCEGWEPPSETLDMDWLWKKEESCSTDGETQDGSDKEGSK